MPKISVIVPVFNVSKYLKQCVESILNQSFGDFELLLINDGSTDNSEEICKSFKDARIKYFKKENGGLSSARNVGIDNSQGEYIAFVDSDDYVDRDFLEFSLKTIESKKCDVVLCGYYIQSDNKAIKNNCNSGFYTTEQLNEAIVELKCKNLIDPSWNKLYTASVIKDNDLRFAEGEIFEDTDFNLRLLKFKPSFFVSDRCFYHYVQHKGSITKKYNKDKLDILKKRSKLLKEVTHGAEKYCDFYYIKNVFSSVIDAFLSLKKSEITAIISKEINDKDFKECALNAGFGGLDSKVIIFVARTFNVSLIYTFCKFCFVLKYKFQKLFLRVK